MAKFSAGGSKGTIDLRKRKAGSHMKALPFFDSPRRAGARNSPLRTRRRRTRTLFAMSCVTLLVAAAYGVHILSYLPQYTVAEVRVEGAKEMSPRLVRAYTETELWNGRFSFLSSQNIFLYSKEKLEQKIAEYFPHISTVKVSRDALLAQAVTITIEERQPKAQWCTTYETIEQCYLVDENGFIFTALSTSTLSGASAKYTFTGGLPAPEKKPVGQSLLSERFTAVLGFLERLARAGVSPQKVNIESETDFSILLGEGYALHATFEGDFEQLARNLELVLNSDALRGRIEELEYIDLRFGNRVYYKFKGEEEQVQ